jgi:hypothetical protein
MTESVGLGFKKKKSIGTQINKSICDKVYKYLITIIYAYDGGL